MSNEEIAKALSVFEKSRVARKEAVNEITGQVVMIMPKEQAALPGLQVDLNLKEEGGV